MYIEEVGAEDTAPPQEQGHYRLGLAFLGSAGELIIGPLARTEQRICAPMHRLSSVVYPNNR